jgi:hypothetical protein
MGLVPVGTCGHKLQEALEATAIAGDVMRLPGWFGTILTHLCAVQRPSWRNWRWSDDGDDGDYGWGTGMNIQADFREPPHEAV